VEKVEPNGAKNHFKKVEQNGAKSTFIKSGAKSS